MKISPLFLKAALCAAAWCAPLQAALDYDTLEIRVLRVEFKEESPDNSLTTGLGSFNTDSDTASANYSLDPQGSRGSASYWQNHLGFAAQYYRALSGGKLVVSYDVYPKAQNSYRLSKYIIDYNRTARKKDEKLAAYNLARTQDYLSFVSDALAKAATTDNPFEGAPVPGSRRKRAYLIAHAGSSRLLDGGSLGSSGSDTPGDFLDMFVDSTDWKDLKGLSDYAGYTSGFPTGSDTVRQVMVVSETASQDGLNWGINGILVNQIGRQLGMPHTFDIVKGISRLGYFDMMDLAGYNAGNGFLPPLPSAWLRAYMGWTPVKEVRPGPDGTVTVDIAAAGSGLGTEIVKVPITANEYLLIENRQRSLRPDGKVTVTLDNDRTLSLPADSIYTLFADSICTNGSCKANSKKAKGQLLSTDAPDATLPASGIAVWHVNDWYLKGALPYAAVNFWGGDTLRDHQYGIALQEADGVLTLGKAFTNALGQAAYDYGSGADLLPHQRYTDSTTGQLVSELKASGYGNTGSTFGGYSDISVSVAKPADAVLERTANSFMGDSVRTWRSLSMPVTIRWGTSAIANSSWPRALAGQALPRGMAFAQVSGRKEPVVAISALDGTLQLFDPRGNAACDPDTLVALPSTTGASDSSGLCRASRAQGLPLGLASSQEYLLSLHAGQGLYATRLFADDSAVTWTRDSLVARSALAGPLLQDSLVWFADSSSLRSLGFSPTLVAKSTSPWPNGFIPQELSLCGDVDKDQVNDIAAVGTNGLVAVRRSSDGAMLLRSAGSASDGRFRIACSDFNRDGRPDAFVLGDKGHGWFLDVQEDRLLSPMRAYQRGQSPAGASASEHSAPALADLNQDGYPEAVFLGYNLLYAVDSSGVPLQGFPVSLAKGEALYSFLSDPLVLDAQGDGVLDILVPANNGNVLAISASAKLLSNGWPLAAGTFAYGDTLYPLSVFVAPLDSLAGNELVALHRSAAQAFSLSLAKTSASGWSLPGNGNARTNWLDPALLAKTTAAAANESIGEFFLFPNPVRHGKASARFRLGAAARSATLELFDITGLAVYKKQLDAPGMGANQMDNLDLSALGSDVYSARLTVKFHSGKQKQSWDRVGVVR